MLAVIGPGWIVVGLLLSAAVLALLPLFRLPVEDEADGGADVEPRQLLNSL